MARGEAAKHPCPQCGTRLQRKALIDTDQRVFSSWRYCEECGWDQRAQAVSNHSHEGVEM
jgi:predicted RNA-binding Zn-ribbon protein involved in translation (DUF1610 family)